MKQKVFLLLISQHCCRSTERIHSTSPSLRLVRSLSNMLPLRSSYSRFSVLGCGAWTNTGITVCLRSSCSSCSNVRSCGSEYAHLLNSAQCRSSRIQFNAIVMENGIRCKPMNFSLETWCRWVRAKIVLL